MAAQLSGDLAEVKSLVPIGTDPHNFEPSPADIKLAGSANLILMNGMNLENWMYELLRKTIGITKIDTVTQGIAPIFSGEYATVVDPHAWLDPVLGKIYVKNIATSLSELMPEHSEIIQFNSKVLTEELQHIHEYSVEKLGSIPPEQRILITSHDAFRYFSQRYQMEVKSVFPTSPSAELTIKDMADLSEIISESGVRAIFPESTINPRLIAQIARDNGLILGGKLYTDSLSEPDGEAGNYIGLLYHNIREIYYGLIGEKSTSSLEHRQSSDEQSQFFPLILVSLVLLGSFLIMWKGVNRNL